jgi:hypothetical protein
MGLDMYGYWRKSGEDRIKDKLFCSWRKHTILHDWMKELWETKKSKRTLEDRFIDGLDGDENYWNATKFNCVQLALTEDDLDSLENDIEEFYIDDVEYFDEYRCESGYYHHDKEFIKNARDLLRKGKEVYYDSWW